MVCVALIMKESIITFGCYQFIKERDLTNCYTNGSEWQAKADGYE